MPTRSLLDLVDDAVPSERTGAEDAALRAQAAFVRALVDEVARCSPADRRVAALHAQLGDELALLARLLQQRDARAAMMIAKPLDVLVVDDDDASRGAAAAAVRAFGYPCRSAADAEEALAAYASAPAAIVLSDWCMPGMSGFDLCALLKRREPQPYVILASAFHENARMLDGADDFVQKPIDLAELEARLTAASRLIRAVQLVAALNASAR